MNRREIELDKTKDQEYQLACIKCDGETYHKVLRSANITERFSVYREEITTWKEYEIIICQGCKEISFRMSSACSENLCHNPETGEYYPAEDVHLYPSRIAGRKQIKDMDTYFLPDDVSEIYKETHGALCARLSILAGIGIRALVESVCREKGAESDNLEKKIDDLVIEGVLTQKNAEALHNTRLMGNKSAHETIAASDEELDIAMDIVENLIGNVYVIPQKAQRLKGDNTNTQTEPQPNGVS